ncbi:hypothetical protein FA15DRAFT_694676 [Coprinopsis marcescibilis]|uniref:Zn(2)-C6 fungal-type domain-containing protein n=1 Tax=Coprinopsis marcescibilis TaxID=230819 RepID=A0A5C3KW25_COPMA|nr:hypothetical protein FA15DRAFT_694676 [Coprinopsis marcescibilis]
MQDSRQTDSPELPSRRAQSSFHEMPTSTQHTSLPSIRQLVHPYVLPPSGMTSQQTSTGGGGGGYDYPSGTMHYPPLPPHIDGSGPSLLHRESTEIYGSVDSDGDADHDHGGPPPKKKRRRQPLSCTECKRRKIKCNREQPCAPCSKRGEQAKCRWAIIEPLEKYVTRAEYDELRVRFDALVAVVERLSQAANFNQQPPIHPVSYYSSPIPGTQAGPSVEAVQPYHQSPVYASMLAPQQPYQPQMDGTTSMMQAPPPPRYSRIYEDSQSPTRGAPSGVPTSPTVPTASGQPSTPSSRHRIPENKSPGSSRRSLDSPRPGLSSMSSGYHPESSESKNYSAQTLMLGERLRRESHKALEDSVILSFATMTLPFRTLHLQVFRTCSLGPPLSFHLPPQGSSSRRISDTSGRHHPQNPQLEDERSRMANPFPGRERG